MKPFKFYIIIIPGTLKYLKFAIWSLQQRDDINVALVSNGLDNAENKNLKSFCLQINCSYVNLKTETVLRHGDALNILLAQHQRKWFCFCDSDIISLDPAANDIPSMKNLSALSSCSAMFWDNEPVTGVRGRCNRWPDGSENLSSFFCIYHTKKTKKQMLKYNIGFENIAVKEIQSITLLAMLKKKGIYEKHKKLDTGKALTVTFDIENLAYCHSDIPSLIHIGGMSCWMFNGDKALVYSDYHLTDKDLYQLAKKGNWLYSLAAERDPDNIMFYLRRQQRLAAARYCFQLISHFVDDTPRPVHSLNELGLSEKIDRIETSLENYYKVAK